MRWQSRLAVGALVVLPTLGAGAAVFAGATGAATHRAAESIDRSLSARRANEPAVVAGESNAARSTYGLRPALGALPAHSGSTPTTWVPAIVAAALLSSVARRRAPRSRAPPLRFL